MGLNNAHEGYEYQDLLGTYFILREILRENNGIFTIDRKENSTDKFDDLSFTNGANAYKNQIKYSNYDANHVLTKDDLATDVNYGLALHSLYKSWRNQSNVSNTQLKICLAWNGYDSSVQNVLKEVNYGHTFENFKTSVYKIELESIWPVNDLPLKSWRLFRKTVKDEKIDRNDFKQFIENLLIEINFPKFSLTLKKPGPLESIVLEQVRKLGIGIYPNKHYTPETFASGLILLVKKARSKGLPITTTEIFKEFEIKIDFGAIEQVFPVEPFENISRIETVKQFIADNINNDRIILVGEPGQGKSWFVENLKNCLESQSVKVVRHYCYTNLDDSLQKDRITKNVFYGNLISEIISLFPHLSNFKDTKYGSNLEELNLLLEMLSNSITF